MSKSSRTSPRKFVEKIALLNRKESESNAAFERIIKEVGATTAQKTPLTINQSHLIPGASRQQRRRSSTGLKRSLSCRMSTRERSLSSINVQPVAQFMVASQGRTAARSNWQLAATGLISSQPHYSEYIRTNSMHRVDAYHDEYQHNHHHHHQPPTTYDDDPMEQPYSLPVSGVPDINIFHVEDQRRASHYADNDDSEGLYIPQVIEQPSSDTEPFHMMDTYMGDYHQQPQQKYNRLTSSLNQPYALCNSRSLPDMSNLGFGSSANTPYGSSYGDETSPIANYETYSCVDYKPHCTTTALDRQHQSSSQPYGETDSVTTHSHQQQQQQHQDSFYQVQEEKWRQPASSVPRLVWNQVEGATKIRVQPNSGHEARDNSEKCSFYQSQEDDWLRQSEYQTRVTAEQLSINQQPQQPLQNHPQQRQQQRQQQHLDPFNHDHQEVLTKSVSSNALYEQANNWNDLGDSCCDGHLSQVSHCDSRSPIRLSKSHYSDLHLVGQSSHNDTYWNS